MTFSKTFLAGAAAFALSFVVSVPAAFAQTPAFSASMAGMNMSAASGDQGDSASTKEFQATDHSIMSDVQYTGNADHDFVAHMIPHHEGVVAMAKVELKYGKDTKLRAVGQGDYYFAGQGNCVHEAMARSAPAEKVIGVA
ncbi:MAG: hypothetical protein CBCREVIR_2695 [Candidatus Burkholderia crenata]|nr:MAG: hypothetical protein CBCREVIR_2695 [Candidatus Burkholderia crenata]